MLQSRPPIQSPSVKANAIHGTRPSRRSACPALRSLDAADTGERTDVTEFCGFGGRVPSDGDDALAMLVVSGAAALIIATRALKGTRPCALAARIAHVRPAQAEPPRSPRTVLRTRCRSPSEGTTEHSEERVRERPGRRDWRWPGIDVRPGPGAPPRGPDALSAPRPWPEAPDARAAGHGSPRPGGKPDDGGEPGASTPAKAA